EHLANHGEGVAAIVRKQALDVLKDKRLRLFCRDYPLDVEEQGALRVAVETVLPPEGILLRDASYREGLTRETGQEDVMVGNRACLDLPDIAVHVVVAEVRAVALLGPAIPFRSEDAATSDGLEAQSETTDACKEV